MKNILRVSVCVVVSTLLCVGSALSATMNDYCITPPFIQTPPPPNMLLMIDNSASMYDLEYQDTTNTYCANAPTTACTAGSTCTGTAYCLASATTTITTTPAACTTDADCQPPKTGGVIGDTCFLAGKNKNTCKTAVVTTTTVTPIACSTDATCNAITAGDTCNNKCTATRQCYDTTYAPYTSTTNYYGYFDATATYGYDFTTSKFTSGATMPSTCTYSSGTPTYFCVNTTGTGTAETVKTDSTGFVASGNFLNWLTVSKFDIEKKILTGGKFDTINNVQIAESRGCGGREFLKAVPGVNLTFAIRGGTPGGIGSTQSLATEYGQTYIDIYTGIYNAAACLSAMNDWVGVVSGTPPNLGTFQNDSKACVGAGTTPLNPTNMWNHALHNCYKGILNIAGGYSGNLGPLEGECQSVYATLSPSSITDPNSGFAICSSVLTYTIGGTAYTGYLGACWNGTDFTGPCTPNDVTQMMNYCQANVTTNPVVDPTSTTSTVTSASIPGFVMQQGLTNLTKVGVLTVKSGLATPPTGLIDKYKDRIRFGAMTFQNNGSGSECSSTSTVPCEKACKNGTVFTTRTCFLASDCPTGETCDVLPKTDGGLIIAYVGAGYCSVTATQPCNIDADCSSLSPSGQTCLASVGTHAPGSGLINSLDGIQATSWTPYAEAFYNAIGYFARYNDPNYANTSAPPSRTDANFSVLNSPNTATSYIATKNPSLYKCQQNNIMLITDGMSTADKSTASENFAALYASQVPNVIAGSTTYGLSGYDTTNHCPSYSGSRSISDLAWVAKNLNIKTLATSSPASTVANAKPTSASEYISSYIVYTGPQASSQPGLCNPYTLMSNTALNGGTSLYPASNPASLYTQLDQAFADAAGKAASGTAASIVNNSGEAGTNMLQAVFYPLKEFGANKISWVGELQNMWFYLDPYLNANAIREDTVSDKILDLQQDDKVTITFDSVQGKTMANRFTNKGVFIDQIGLDSLSPLWRAGELLYLRNLTSSPRALKTSIDGASLLSFSDTNKTVLRPYLNVATDTAAGNVISWVQGVDNTSDTTVRSRTVSYNSNPLSPWRLGDIISSTPKVQPNSPIQGYDLDYNDLTYKTFWSSNNYKSRGMVYVGANDGMLHAFKLGIITKVTDTSHPTQVASITPNTAPPLGQEEWAYIPKNVLPYLQYQMLPDYSHLYAVDATSRLIDVSINAPTGCTETNYWDCLRQTTLDSTNASVAHQADLLYDKTSWRTVLIGGMGLGGASRPSNGTCAVASDCVKAPIVSPTGYENVGLSSYFALDVSEPTSPTFMWEFTDPALGYTLTPPAIVRINGKRGGTGLDKDNPDKSKNGRWFTVFGSGPTGPISTRQFYGRSDQTLKLFIVDLKTGSLIRTIDTNINKAFAGSLTSNSTIDTDFWDAGAAGNYSHDAVYIGYTYFDTANNRWDGGVGRLVTHENVDPSQWTWSKVIDGVGPITTAVASLQDRTNKNLWLYFGAGRYFYKDTAGVDDADADPADATARRYIYGIKEPCYPKGSGMGAANAFDASCSTAVSVGSLTDQSDNASSALSSSAAGWKIKLSGSNTSFKSERLLTNPSASYNGNVTFTTFMPTVDVCGYGGQTFVWVVKGMSGAAPAASSLKGKLILQLTTGAFQTVDFNNALTGRQGRRTGTGDTSNDAPAGGYSGGTSKDSSPEQKPPKGVPRILQIREQ